MYTTMAEFRIKRKPVASPQPNQSDSDAKQIQRPPLPTSASFPAAPDVSDFRDTGTWGPPNIQRAETDVPHSQRRSKSPVQKAYGEARHFLGGLIAHPAESTKHFTILRHSHGVVFYRGSTTTIAVSIFSDAPLPPNRTLWLQSKGFSGKTGMRAKAFLRLYDSWLNVTPTIPVKADQVSQSDERAWQRDIGKFRQKPPTHQLRETIIARIPVEAGDGYFSLVLCRGEKKNVLCTSPVFRVLSTSTDPSSIRGASLSTLPLELGAMVLGMYTQNVAQNFLSPAAETVKNRIAPYQPSWVTETAATTAFEVSGAGDRIGSSLKGSENHSPFGSPALPEDSSYLERGPVQPYPVDFKAQGEAVESVWGAEPPKFNLIKLPDWVLERFNGYYFGWARYEQIVEKSMSSWQHSILAVKHFDPSESALVKISQALKRIATLRLLDNSQLPNRSKIEVRVMGFIRPPPPQRTEKQLEDRETAAEAAMLADACDASFTQDVLDRPTWAPEASGGRPDDIGMLQRTQTGLSSVKTNGKKWAEQVPLHLIGVRSPMAEISDRRVAVNGLYIVR